MAGPENDPVKQNPQAGKEAAPSAPATKYVGTPAVGTSKAAAAGGIAAVGPDIRGRPAPPSSRVDRHHGISGRMVPCLLPLFLPRTLFEPRTSFKIGYPSDYALGVDTKWQQKYRIWVDRTPDRLFVIYARCTDLGCTPDWKPSENKFKCPCHGSGYDSEGINFEGPAPRPMDRAKVDLAPDGQIIVDVSKLYSWPKGQPSQFSDPGSFLST
jgi:cytochrome b6-f complex iron-sulfur subunit